MTRVWDTSALAAVLLGERGTEELREMLAADGGLVVWWGTKVEGGSAIGRARRLGLVSEADRRVLMAKLGGLAAAALEVEPTEEVRECAMRLLEVHDLRAADALQLAAALIWAGPNPRTTGLVCLDRRLRAAAVREGLEVFPSES